MNRAILKSLLVALSVALAGPVLAQQGGFLKTKVDPGRAGVFIDGNYVGPAANLGMARKYAVAAGEHEVKLVEPRYKEVTQKVTIQAGKTATLAVKMEALPKPKPPFGSLKVENAPKYSAVYVNGAFMGHADEMNGPGQALLMPAGEYIVKVVPSGGGNPVEEKVTLTAGKTTIVTVK